jgi:hypothetical protein
MSCYDLNVKSRSSRDKDRQLILKRAVECKYMNNSTKYLLSIKYYIILINLVGISCIAWNHECFGKVNGNLLAHVSILC